MPLPGRRRLRPSVRRPARAEARLASAWASGYFYAMEAAMIPDTVVKFWDEAGPSSWFSKDEAFDADLRTHFHGAHMTASAASAIGSRAPKARWD